MEKRRSLGHICATDSSSKHQRGIALIQQPKNNPKHSPYPAPKPQILVLSGPSGVGKDLLLSRLRDSGAPYFFAITATTRPKRDGEQDGIDYYFVTKAQFEMMIANDELLEWATVYENYYGVPKAQVDDALSRGQHVILKIDIQGAATIRKIAPDALFIFLAPPSEAELERRLRGRESESESTLATRIEQARHELKQAEYFDYTIVHETNRTDEAVHEIQRLVNEQSEAE